MKTFDLEEVEATLQARWRRERWYKPGVWMLYVLRRKTGEACREVRWAWQRVFRGWDDRASWNIDAYLAKHLGEQLTAQADFAHGWPVDPWTYETWVAALKENGEALLAYYRMDRFEDETEWDPVYAKAQAALRWVADNLANLWD